MTLMARFIVFTMFCSGTSVLIPAYANAQETDPRVWRLYEDMRKVPVPPDALEDLEVTSWHAEISTVSRYSLPELRVMVYAMAQPCSAAESFYRRHWKGFKLSERMSGDRRQFLAALRWRGDDLRPVRADSLAEAEEKAGLVMLFTELPPVSANDTVQQIEGEIRGRLRIPPGVVGCHWAVINFQTADAPRRAEQRLIEDLKKVPVPPGAVEDEQSAEDLISVAAAYHDSFPRRRVMAYAVAQPCSAIESFYRGQWKTFALVEHNAGNDVRIFDAAGFEWRGDDLRPVRSAKEAEEKGGLLMFVIEVPATGPNEFSRQIVPERTLNISSGVTRCEVGVTNLRNVDVSR